MDFRPMTMLSNLRESAGRLLGARYAKTGLAAGVAMVLVATLVAVNPGPRRVGTTAGDPDDRSGFGLRENEGSTDVAAVEGSPDTSPVPPGAPGSSTPGAAKVAGKATKGASASGKKNTGPATVSSSGGGTSDGGVTSGGGTSSGGTSDGVVTSGGGTSGGGTSGGGTVPPERCGFPRCDRVQGVTDKEIRIGVRWEDPKPNEEEYNSGRFHIRFGDVEKIAEALEADIARRNPNGIHGRKVKVVFYPTPGSEEEGAAGETEAQVETRRCIKFAEDLKVFAVVTHWMGRTGAQCLADRGVFLFRTGQLVGDDKVLKQTHPWVWSTPEKSNNRMWSTLIPSLKEQGYFERRQGENRIKVGLVIQDDPAYTGVRDLILEKLKEAGVTEPVEEFLYATSGAGVMFDFAALDAAGKAAASKFRAADVNRVFFAPSFLIFNFYMTAAEGKGSNTPPHRPRYAVDSTMVLNGAVEKGVPLNPAIPEQLHGAVGIGWKKQSDMSGTGAGPYSAREQQCADVMERAAYPIVDRTNPVLAMQHCETFWAFEEAAKRAGRALTPGSMAGGIRALGSSWESVISYGVDFGRAAERGTGDGTFAHRWVQYNFAEKRFVYLGGVRPDR